MKTAVKHCVSSAYQIGTGGGVEGRRGLAPPPIRFTFFIATFRIKFTFFQWSFHTNQTLFIATFSY